MPTDMPTKEKETSIMDEQVQRQGKSAQGRINVTREGGLSIDAQDLLRDKKTREKLKRFADLMEEVG